MDEQRNVKLNNGIVMPRVGLGVWKSLNGEAQQMVATALQNGYRLIDTAKQYGNEAGVGAGLQEGMDKAKLKRADIFLTTKIWNGDQGNYDQLRKSFNEQLGKLQTDYVDLLLLHWPVFDKYLKSWQALEDIYRDGQAKAIGVCNFNVDHLTNLLDHAEVKPAVNQIEFNPGSTSRIRWHFARCKRFSWKRGHHWEMGRR